MQHVQDQIELYMKSYEKALSSGNFKQRDLVEAQMTGYTQCLYDVGLLTEKQFREILDIK